VKAVADQYRGNNSMNDGEVRMKYYAAKVLPYSFAEENKMLLKRLEIYSKKTMSY
jgi:hypothetical protein